MTPGQPDLYLTWLRAARPHPPQKQAEAEKAAEELMAYVRDEWLPKGKVQDGAQIKYFAELDARAAELPPEHLPYFWDEVSHLLDSWFATGAHRRARRAEREHGLPVDPEYLVDNALILTRAYGLRGAEQSTHLRFLREALPPERAHRETARFIEVTAAHNFLEPPEDLPQLIRASAEAVGLGPEEDARLLGTMLKGQCAWRATEELMRSIAKVFRLAQPDDSVRERLLGLYTRAQSRTNGKGLLQVLQHSGAFEAMLSGRLVPEGGCGGWLTGFVEHYSHYSTGRGTVNGQPILSELYPLLEKLAGQVKTEGRPVRIHCTRYGPHPSLDARLADVCLRLGIPVEDPGPGTHLRVPPRRKDDYARLRADPVLGPRLGRVVWRPGAGGPLV